MAKGFIWNERKVTLSDMIIVIASFALELEFCFEHWFCLHELMKLLAFRICWEKQVGFVRSAVVFGLFLQGCAIFLLPVKTRQGLPLQKSSTHALNCDNSGRESSKT